MTDPHPIFNPQSTNEISSSHIKLWINFVGQQKKKLDVIIIYIYIYIYKSERKKEIKKFDK